MAALSKRVFRSPGKVDLFSGFRVFQQGEEAKKVSKAKQKKKVGEKLKDECNHEWKQSQFTN